MSEVRDNRAANCFTLEFDGATALASYRREADRIVFTHTEVPQALEGRGVGGRLIRAALDAARAEKLQVLPECSFVRHFIDTHPDYQDLL